VFYHKCSSSQLGLFLGKTFRLFSYFSTFYNIPKTSTHVFFQQLYSVHTKLRLTKLAPHTKATIVEFEESEIANHLMEMGFIPGEDVLLEITAPLGDPLSIMIAGYNLSIRKSEAENIWVKPIQ
jgi:ferrous iron transport protein A